MRGRLLLPLLLVVLVASLAYLLTAVARHQTRAAVIAVHPDEQYQVIHGWQAGAQASLYPLDLMPHRQETLDELFDKAVDAGLTRLRLAVPSAIENTRDFAAERRAGRLSRAEERCARYSTVNDDADPATGNPRGFIWTDFDREVREDVLPMARRLEARGERLWLHLQYLAFTNQLCGAYQYHHDDPAEYAEFVVTVYEHLRDVFGLVPDSWSSMNEPDNTPHWTAERLAAATAAAAVRLRAAGFTPAFVVPDTTNASRAVPYFEAMWAYPDLRPYLKELSYHRYGGVSHAVLSSIGAVARERGLASAMMEQIGAGAGELHADLTLAQASAWEQSALSWPDVDTGAHYFILDPYKPRGARVQLSATGQYLRQYFRALRPGARRIGATSDDARFQPVAARHETHGMSVVVLAHLSGRLTFTGLAPGKYETSCRLNRAPWEQDADPCAGRIDVDDAGTSTVFMPDAGVLSLRQVGPAAR